VVEGNRSSSGALGERLACRYVQRLGWRVLARNYRAARAEIDVIAEEGEELVFVEVKTLAGSDFGEPEDRVEDFKQRQLSRAAIHYVTERRLEEREIRFDVIAVLLGDGEPRIEHFRSAFELHRSFRA